MSLFSKARKSRDDQVLNISFFRLVHAAILLEIILKKENVTHCLLAGCYNLAAAAESNLVGIRALHTRQEMYLRLNKPVLRRGNSHFMDHKFLV